ncbi:helix-turn-helix domain-containing protein [Mesobacillus subterraneus]|uniref:DNA-binding protein n=1 Tax=Mesobacillus subterraneus TaxID=285983 RepID=A0A3R9E9I0_9BACI|nr:helix-turn-helix domain-containing protein [Mesobacillus subterraneus]RSD25152.1 DNA-binding protein [Mesobacillus subterraneus]
MKYAPEDIQLIKDQLGSQSLSTIAKRLNRSIVALEVKITRLGLSHTKSYTGMLTAGELAKILNVDRNTVMQWILNHELDSYQRITRNKKRFTFINIDDFWSWAEHNRHKINFSKLEPDALPPEPAWVAEERKIARQVTNYKSWTKQEEKQVLELYCCGKTLAEIADLVGRTRESIRKKIKRLTENHFS